MERSSSELNNGYFRPYVFTGIKLPGGAVSPGKPGGISGGTHKVPAEKYPPVGRLGFSVGP